MTDRQATLFEELEELREQVHRMVRMAPLEDQVPAFIAVGQGIDALLARHRESERWHYPADGDVPPEWSEVIGDYGGLWRAARRNSQGWIRADGEPSPFSPTRWRYLSPADVPEAP